MPSTSTSTWLPTRPRTNGDPPPWFVFWTNTPGARDSASALVRGAVRSSSVPLTTDTDRGTSNVSRSARVAVTDTDSASRSVSGASANSTCGAVAPTVTVTAASAGR